MLPVVFSLFSSRFIMIILAPDQICTVLQQSLVLAGLHGTSYTSQHKQIHLLCYTSLFSKAATQLNLHCYFRFCSKMRVQKNIDCVAALLLSQSTLLQLCSHKIPVWLIMWPLRIARGSQSQLFVEETGEDIYCVTEAGRTSGSTLPFFLFFTTLKTENWKLMALTSSALE